MRDTSARPLALMSAVLLLVPRRLEDTNLRLDYFEARDRRGEEQCLVGKKTINDQNYKLLCEKMVEGGGVVLRDRSLPVNYRVIAVLTRPEVRAKQGERDIERGREFASKIKMSCFCFLFF